MKVSVSLCLAIYFIHQANGKNLEDFMSRRNVRDVSDPPPVDCKMSPWSSWTPCDPCTNTTHRSRGIEAFGQFKGIRCIRPIGDKKLCKPSSRCDVDPPPVCKANQWRCESEICINKNLKCNGDYDCGQPDTSDEDDCEVIRSPCGHTAVFESDLAIQAGYGINILGSGPRMNPFNNRLYKGQCGRIREPTTLEYNRLPWNVGVLNYETKVEESSSKEMYEDIHSLIREITTESSFSLDVSLNFKFTPTEASSADSASVGDGGDAASPGIGSDAAGAEAGSDAASPGRSSDAAGADAGSDAASPGRGSDAAGAEAGSDAASPGRSSDAAGADAGSDAASPGRGSDAVTLGFSASAGIGATTETTNIIKQLSEYTTTKRKSFMRVKGKLQLATYRMRQRGLEVSQTFLDSVDALPLEYEKGQYFGFIEDYGTHFTKNGKVGGEYELVYIMNEDIRQTKEITEKTLKQCFEVRAEAGFQFAKVVEGGGHVKPKTCKELTTKPTDEDTKRGVVDKVLISVRGGSPGSAVAMKSQLTKDGVIDYTQYVEWANTITALPALIHSDPEPIYNAIPLDFPDAQPRRDNLRKALKDYVSEYSVCKCLPCQNGGTVMQIDGECKCMCSPGTEGVACQIIDREIVKDKSFEQIGNWGCWGPWSECSGGRQTRKRSCNTQHLSNAKCKGDTTSEDYC